MRNHEEIRGMWLGVPELASALGLAVKTIYKLRSESPDRLPPSFRLPGSAKVMYLRTDDEKWIVKGAKGV